MAPQTRRFANHPGAKEAPASALEYRIEEDRNPPMRGYPLVLASAIIERLPFLQKLLWNNAKFGQAKYTPGLDGVPWRIQPDVIPLADGNSPDAMLPLEPELCRTQPAGLAGRFLSVADYHELYQSGAASPLDVVSELVRLTDAARRPLSPYAAAWTQVRPDEVLKAAEASAARWAAGKPLSFVDGVPFGVKDDLAVEGFVSRMGMRITKGEEYFRRECKDTVWPAKALQEAGAIMVGKMNQHEIGMDTTGCNPSTGTPINWYNKSYYPGGSSSGAGSALCAGMVPITIGTDAGGSIRIPSSFCGVYGLKPTHNRTCHMSSSMCTVGPMASTATDLTIAYRFASQPNPNDPVQNLLAVSTPPDSSAKKYVGVCRQWVTTADADVLEIFEKSLAHLTTLGYEVVDVDLPFLREGQLAHSATCVTEAAADARARANNPDRFLDLLSPATRVTLCTGTQTPAIDYLRYGQIRVVIMRHLAFLFNKYPGLLLLTPVTPAAGWPIIPGDQTYGCIDANKLIRNMTFVWLANMSGCPAVSVPAGYAEPSKEGDGGPLPVGLMALAEWGMEEQLLAFARERETYLNHVYPGGRRRPEEWLDIIKLARKWPGVREWVDKQMEEAREKREAEKMKEAEERREAEEKREGEETRVEEGTGEKRVGKGEGEEERREVEGKRVGEERAEAGESQAAMAD